MHSDEHWILPTTAVKPRKVRTRSLFITMRDGVRIAIDLHLPESDHPLPTILRMTRYLRSLTPRGPLSKLLDAPSIFDVYAKIRPRFLAEGYAWIDVDVRGTGASGGTWESPWHEDLVRDSEEIVRWVSEQSFSNGRVGALGISYDGTCADMSITREPPPALKAIAPMFALYDVFADVAFPGGVFLEWFIDAWGKYNQRLDDNAFHEAFVTPIRLISRAATHHPSPRAGERLVGLLGRASERAFARVASLALRSLVVGVSDVKDGDGAEKSAASEVARRRNIDVFRVASSVVHRDDTVEGFGDLTIDAFSPHTFAEAQRRSNVAIYSYSGWRDGAYPSGAIKRFAEVATKGSRLTIGPWAHTGQLRIHAFDEGRPTRFDHAGELISFFDVHLKEDVDRGDERPIHFFVTGEERWHASDVWPPPGGTETTLHLGGDRRLTLTKPEVDTSLHYRVDGDAGTGERSRWRSLLSLVPGDYPDRAVRDRKCLVLESSPLRTPFKMIGETRLRLSVSWDRGTDGQVFAYLEDVAPDGRINYVTEGQLRAIHRGSSSRPPSFLRVHAQPLTPNEPVDLEIMLLPMAHRFAAGHRVRLALAAADRDHFAPPPDPLATMTLHPGSSLHLPTHGSVSFE